MNDLSVAISRYAEASRQLVSRAGAVILGDLPVTAGLESTRTIMSACAPRAAGVEFSDFITVTPDGESARLLSVAAPLVRDGTSYAVPNRSLVFLPRVLRAHATRFRIGSPGRITTAARTAVGFD